MRRIPLAIFALIAATTELTSQTLASPSVSRDRSGHARLTVYLDGNVKDAFGKSSSTSVASGAVGLRYQGGLFATQGQVNVASKTDTLGSNFGSTLLLPGSGKAFNSGLVDIRTRPLRLARSCPLPEKGGGDPWCRIGVHGYVSASTTRWATVQNNGAVTATTDVPVIGSGLGAYFNFFNGRVGENDDAPRASMALDVGYARRSISGDLGSDPELLRQLIGTTDRSFQGIEVGLTLQLNQLRAGFTYYSMGGDVRGLSNGQVVAGIAIQAALLNDVFVDVP